ncbi:unnamed protein product [Protopolystoma xenopodis]|uniref:Uncharacterized protein n=1 Tax=Protopolystoma xenopodis TaxID=117903 RepID=A0A448WZP7_9PLAT|nr:unnamed protein product [Protopolystoma xenopodis]
MPRCSSFGQVSDPLYSEICLLEHQANPSHKAATSIHLVVRCSSNNAPDGCVPHTPSLLLSTSLKKGSNCPMMVFIGRAEGHGCEGGESHVDLMESTEGTKGNRIDLEAKTVATYSNSLTSNTVTDHQKEIKIFSATDVTLNGLNEKQMDKVWEFSRRTLLEFDSITSSHSREIRTGRHYSYRSFGQADNKFSEVWNI